MEHRLSPRSQAVLDRIDAWAARGLLRRLAVRIGVTVVGPLAVLAGVAMLVLPGPGLVVIALGLALLALEYPWARGILGAIGAGVSWVRRMTFPPDASPRRRLAGVLGAGAFVALSAAATAGVSAAVAAQTFL